MRERKRRGKGGGREGDFCPESAGGRLTAKSIWDAQAKLKGKVLSSAVPGSVEGHRCDEFGRRECEVQTCHEHTAAEK